MSRARVTIGVPVSREGFAAAANALVPLARKELRAGGIPPLYRSGVRYRREAPGQERWQLPREVYERGFGDCEDLSIWLAAELQLRGIAARVAVLKTGPRLWHAVVQLPDGRILDPSRRLGMKGKG